RVEVSGHYQLRYGALGVICGIWGQWLAFHKSVSEVVRSRRGVQTRSSMAHVMPAPSHGMAAARAGPAESSCISPVYPAMETNCWTIVLTGTPRPVPMLSTLCASVDVV